MKSGASGVGREGFEPPTPCASFRSGGPERTLANTETQQITRIPSVRVQESSGHVAPNGTPNGSPNMSAAGRTETRPSSPPPLLARIITHTRLDLGVEGQVRLVASSPPTGDDARIETRHRARLVILKHSPIMNRQYDNERFAHARSAASRRRVVADDAASDLATLHRSKGVVDLGQADTATDQLIQLQPTIAIPVEDPRDVALDVA